MRMNASPCIALSPHEAIATPFHLGLQLHFGGGVHACYPPPPPPAAFPIVMCKCNVKMYCIHKYLYTIYKKSIQIYSNHVFGVTVVNLIVALA